MQKIALISAMMLAIGSVQAENKITGDAYWGDVTTNTTLEQEKLAKEYVPPSYEDFKSSSLKKVKKKVEEITKPRQDAIKSGALLYGSQLGYANEAYRINKVLEKGKMVVKDPKTGKNREIDLDKIFDFSAVLIEDGLLAPVIAKASDLYNQDGLKEVRYAKTLYKIIEDSRIVTYTPTWRDYLELPIEKIQSVAASLHPRTPAEAELWDEYLAYGRKEGVEQAKEVFDGGYSRLLRDFGGMLTYIALEGKGQSTAPKLERIELGITGGGKEMAIGDKVIRKVREAELVPDKKRWLKD